MTEAANYVHVDMDRAILFDRYYLHQDGGLYLVKSVGISTVDQSVHVVYEHVFPFKLQTRIRPFDEWTPTRFKLLSSTEVVDFLEAFRDRTQYQEIVTARRIARKALESA